MKVLYMVMTISCISMQSEDPEYRIILKGVGQFIVDKCRESNEIQKRITTDHQCQSLENARFEHFPVMPVDAAPLYATIATRRYKKLPNYPILYDRLHEYNKYYHNIPYVADLKSTVHHLCNQVKTKIIQADLMLLPVIYKQSGSIHVRFFSRLTPSDFTCCYLEKYIFYVTSIDINQEILDVIEKLNNVIIVAEIVNFSPDHDHVKNDALIFKRLHNNFVLKRYEIDQLSHIYPFCCERYDVTHPLYGGYIDYYATFWRLKRLNYLSQR